MGLSDGKNSPGRLSGRPGWPRDQRTKELCKVALEESAEEQEGGRFPLGEDLLASGGGGGEGGGEGVIGGWDKTPGEQRRNTHCTDHDFEIHLRILETNGDL